VPTLSLQKEVDAPLQPVNQLAKTLQSVLGYLTNGDVQLSLLSYANRRNFPLLKPELSISPHYTFSPAALHTSKKLPISIHKTTSLAFSKSLIKTPPCLFLDNVQIMWKLVTCRSCPAVVRLSKAGKD